MGEDKLIAVISMLRELEEDSSVPKNVKTRIALTIKELQEEKEISIKISRALAALEEITDDSNMQTYTRTQIFNIVSALEFVNA